MKRMIPKILILGILAMACLMIVMMQRRKVGQYSEVVHEVNEIDDEVDNLNRKLEEIEIDYKEESFGKAGLSLVIAQVDNTVMSYMYPILKDNGYNAVIALDLYHMPGDEGCISKEDFQTLMDEGWSYCINWNGKDFQEYMTEMNKRLEEAKLSVSHTLYVRRGFYTEDLKAEAEKMGIKTIIHHGEANKPFVSKYNNEDKCWEIGDIGYYNDYIKNYIESAVDDGGNLILSVGNESGDELFNVTNFNRLMNGLNDYVKADKIYLDTIGNVRKYKAGLAKDQKERDQEYKEETDEVKEEIENLDEKRKEKVRK